MNVHLKYMVCENVHLKYMVYENVHLKYMVYENGFLDKHVSSYNCICAVV